MSNNYPEWLPPLVLLSDYGGNWNSYLEAIYSFFKTDFIDSNPHYGNFEIKLKKSPLREGKEATFWHLISSGQDEEERLPDLRRCERIKWPRPMIEAVRNGSVKTWRNKRRNEERIVIALDDFSYVVILAERKQHILLWTAYCVEQEHRRRKLRKEYERLKSD